MPVTIKLTFPAGRYHATPWGRHVNEGVAEWPPSPWRLLRALVAVWKRTDPDLSEQQTKRILSALAHPPLFKLPVHRVAHTRHYMPWGKNDPADRTLVFDTFVSIGRSDPLMIGWPNVELAPEDRGVLNNLLGNLTSLGRAEGWIHAELTDGGADWNCAPSDLEVNPVPVFCPDPATAFGDEHYPTLDPKKLAKGKINPSEYLFDCPRWHLCLDTETIHEKRWPSVPGARWVNYSRPQEIRLATSRSAIQRPRFTVVRFLLDGPVLPLVTDTIRVSEKFRIAAMGRFKRWCLSNPERADKYLIAPDEDPPRYASPTISGKDVNAICLTGHEHAYYLPTVEGADLRRITHVTVFAQRGFDENEITVLTGLKCVDVGDLKLRVQLIGLGQPYDFKCQLFGEATEWCSITPFVGPSHIGIKAKQRYLRKALAREVRRKLGDSSAIVSITETTIPNHPMPWEFRRGRSKKGDDGLKRPCGYFRVTLSKPVVGPLCLGFSSHFGLGMLVPAV